MKTQNTTNLAAHLQYALFIVSLLGLLSSVPVEQKANAREIYNLNQQWEFFLPSEPAPWSPDAATRVQEGQFPEGNTIQTIRFAARKARFLCLEARSAQNGPYASGAEFDLLDSDGKPLPRSSWKLQTDSQETDSGEVLGNIVDGDPKTIWHTEWKQNAPGHPHYLVVDLGKAQVISGFRYLPRPAGNNGSLKTWAFYASEKAIEPPQLQQPASPPNSAAKWKRVTLPHSVRLEPLNASGGRNYQGLCWYRRDFQADPSWRGKRVFLRFEGAMQVAELWLNGEKILTHYGGYLPFTVDLSDKLQPGGKNTLLLKLNNSDNAEVPPGKRQSGLDFTYFGGLYRDVTLETTDPLHISDEYLANRVAAGGIFFRTLSAATNETVASVQTDVDNDYASSQSFVVRQELRDAKGKLVASDTRNMTMPGRTNGILAQLLKVAQPSLWHPNHPSLYTLRTTILLEGKPVDERETRVGLRRIAFKPEGLFINGEKFYASGFNHHQDHPYVGYAVPKSQQYRDVRKLREASMTSFRSHYPHDSAFMDACDQLGVLAIVSNPGWQFMGSQLWASRVYQNAREMVRRDRNRPSVVIWEPFPNETSYPEPFARNLHAITHEEYPGDQCFTAADGEIAHAKAFVDIVWSREPVPGHPHWGREWGDSVDNWDDQQGRVRVARGWGETPLLTQAINHAIKLDALLRQAGGSQNKTTMSGAGLWAGIDCYRGYHHQPFLGGPLDLFRLPKFSYYFFQSQRDPAVKLDDVDSGPMVFIANYGTPYSPANVTVFSNCEEVRFYENGKLTATQKPDEGFVLLHPPFTFQAKAEKAEKTTYYMSRDYAANSEAGYHYDATEYRAEGIIGGKVVAMHRVQAPGVMRRIVLDVDYAGRDLVADGGDWIRVYARVCDARGNLHPFADDEITFTVEGEGGIINDDRIEANPVRAEAGIATALIRSTTKPGKITVRASAFGLQTGETVIESKSTPANRL